MSLPTRRSATACTAFNRLSASPKCRSDTRYSPLDLRGRHYDRRRSAIPFSYNRTARNLLFTNSFAFIVKISMVLYISFFALVLLYRTWN